MNIMTITQAIYECSRGHQTSIEVTGSTVKVGIRCTHTGCPETSYYQPQISATPLFPNKITLTTLKKFVAENKSNLHINVTSDFDGMTDCVERRDDGFAPVVTDDNSTGNTLGIQGVWLVGRSRDYFTEYNENGHNGIRVYNSCGSFIVAIKIN